jgi:hypothetical protein
MDEWTFGSAIPENPAETPGFLTRCAAAYQAYWEHLPLRAPQRPKGPHAAVPPLDPRRPGCPSRCSTPASSAPTSPVATACRRADFRATSVTVPDAPVITAASFEIQAGRPGLVAV